MAKHYMGAENPGHTLQTTAVIHEAYLRLIGNNQNWANRDHFFGVAATAMRHVLIDYAKKQRAAKRGGGIRRVSLDEGLAVSGDGGADELIALNDALESLAKLDERKARVVELRYFGSLSVADTARLLRVSPETVERDWKFAKSFLQREAKRGKQN
jgi:RNA polymerase sigma factor (TIGR02999 family)